MKRKKKNQSLLSNKKLIWEIVIGILITLVAFIWENKKSTKLAKRKKQK